ncbi:hypothetical protein [Actinoplanes sp. NPDC026623]|uniref:hypothetical protein n=1 Tax=Actinoplanes sp. NPDC026623 TaxID=3155610 RepID=UPI0033D1DF46
MSDGAAISRPSLIAPEAETKWYEGAGIVEAAMGAKDGFAEDNLLAGFGNSAVVGLSALGAIMDPFQAIFAAGVGWLMEHVDCLREPLDWLAGDPKEIEGHVATWRNLQGRTYEAAEYFAGQVRSTTARWGSEAAAAYRAKASEMADGALALGEVADAMAEATLIAGSVVGVVRNTVRDLIAEVVGAAVSKALQALLVVTIPKIVAEVALMVAEYTGKIMQVLRRLTDAISALGGKFPALAEVCTRITKVMDSAISETTYGSLVLNSSKLHTADSYIADSDGAAAAYKHAYRTLAQGDAVVYGTKARVAVDALREGVKMNSIQNGSATADTLTGEQPAPPSVELPL